MTAPGLGRGSGESPPSAPESGNAGSPPSLTPETIRSEVEAICASSHFNKSKRLLRFLRYVVDLTLTGQDDKITEYAIAVDVYDRAESFDPHMDNIVRTEARRLRAKLRAYYENEGIEDCCVIDLPSGTYQPTFELRHPGQADRRIGQQISKYLVVERLGSGLSGVVYRATDTQLDRTVAFRVLTQRAEPMTPRISALLADARIAAALKHPRISAVYEVVEQQGLAFIATEYVGGRTLKDYLADGPLPLEAALKAGQQIIEGLSAAHGRGIAHRDLKPANIIVSEGPGGWDLKIIDFGLAPAVEASERIAAPDEEAYLSPEQRSGQRGDPSSDIWSFGAILYAMLAGKHRPDRPGNGTDEAEPVPEPILSLRPDMPPALDAIISRCMAEVPAARYSRIEDVAQELQSLSNALSGPREPAPGLEAAARQQSRIPRSVKWFAVPVTLALVWVATQVSSLFKPRASSGIVRLVIMPFDDLSAVKVNNGVTLAIADSLAAKLTKIRGLEIVSRNSAYRLRETGIDVQSVASNLHADYILDGSFVRANDQCRVMAHLIRPSGEAHVWTEDYRFPWSNIFEVQDTVSREVAKAVSITLTDDERRVLNRRASVNPAAYEAFANGLAGLNRYVAKYDRTELATIEASFLRALEIQPTYTDAMTELGRLYVRALYPPQGPRTPWVIKATSILERALIQDPNNVSANSLLGTLYGQEGDFVRGIDYASKAVSLNPRDGEAQGEMASVYTSAGFYEAALDHARTAARLDPLSVVGNGGVAWNLAKLGRFDEALEAARGFERSGGSPAIVALAYADVYYRQEKPDEAVAVLKRFGVGNGKMYDAPSERLYLGLARVMKGDLKEAEQILFNERGAEPRSLDFSIRISAMMGDPNLTMDLIERSPFYHNYRWVVTEPSLRRFRTDVRFQGLVRRLYTDWQRNVAAAKDRLASIPQLPEPEKYLTSGP